jgi:hypothetical protein
VVVSLPSSALGSKKALVQYRQIDIGIILGKIGFDCISAHAQGFLKAVLGASPPVKGQDSPGSLRCSAIITAIRVFHISVYECLSAVVFVLH